MNENFDKCLKFVLQKEGGRVDNPSDRGGKTNCGVTQGAWDAHCRADGRPTSDVNDLKHADAVDFYRRRYWDVCRCGELAYPVDLVVFDAAVNHGPKQSIRFLQRAVGATDDGILGPRTLERVRTSPHPPRGIAEHILNQRDAFYGQLVEQDPSQRVFLRGWLRRVADLRKEVAKEPRA